MAIKRLMDLPIDDRPGIINDPVPKGVGSSFSVRNTTPKESTNNITNKVEDIIYRTTYDKDPTPKKPTNNITNKIEDILYRIIYDKDPTPKDTSSYTKPKYQPLYLTIDPEQFPTIKYSFEYLAYLIFSGNPSIILDEFYTQVSERIANKDFFDNNDVSDTYTDLDIYLIQHTFERIWIATLKQGIVELKNIIGFYIYFNYRLNFFPTLVQGEDINDFIDNMTLYNVVQTLYNLGLYPINETNMFNRVWNSYKFSHREDETTAEIKLSLAEYNRHKPNKQTSLTYEGYTEPIENLKLKANVYLGSTSNKEFTSYINALNRLIEIVNEYPFENNIFDNYLRTTVPLTETNKRNKVVYNKGIVLLSEDSTLPSNKLWHLLESFETAYKINSSYINKNNIKKLFFKYINSEYYPKETQTEEYLTIWTNWIEFLVEYLTNIDVTDFNNAFNNIVDITNIDFIKRYLDNNDSFQSEMEGNNSLIDGMDNLNYLIFTKISDIYEKLDNLKLRTRKLIQYINTEDKRFNND